MPTVVKCKNCGLVLDGPSDTPAEQREPCSRCGSTARTFEVEGGLTARVQVGASVAWTRYREFTRRHMGWTAVNVWIIGAGGLLGLVLGEKLGAVVGIIVGAIVYFLIPSGVEKVIEIRQGGS